jgi:endoglucanase
MKVAFIFLSLLCIPLSCVTPVASQTATQPLSSVPASRVAHLRHGINASEWFAQVFDPKGYTKEHLQNWTTAEDIALIKSMGFDHVRLSINPEPMMPRNRPGEIPADYLGYLDDAVKMMLDHGLAVILDVHPESDFKARIGKEDNFVQQFSEFWRTLARHYSTWDQERVFFEIMNEPELSDPYRWYGIQAKVAVAIREGAPQHTIIAAGTRWSDDDDLVFLEPLRDPNVIYNFHFYSPHVFTHQGATWGSPFWPWVKALQYPSNPENAVQVAGAVPEAKDRLEVIRYGYESWNAAHIDAEITQAAEWAAQRHVPLICDEFGVYRKNAQPQDRAAWLHDLRTSLEKHGIGWTMWDYSGGFAVVNTVNGHHVPDEVTIRALGLKTP